MAVISGQIRTLRRSAAGVHVAFVLKLRRGTRKEHRLQPHLLPRVCITVGLVTCMIEPACRAT